MTIILIPLRLLRLRGIIKEKVLAPARYRFELDGQCEARIRGVLVDLAGMNTSFHFDYMYIRIHMYSCNENPGVARCARRLRARASPRRAYTRPTAHLRYGSLAAAFPPSRFTASARHAEEYAGVLAAGTRGRPVPHFPLHRHRPDVRRAAGGDDGQCEAVGSGRGWRHRRPNGGRLVGWRRGEPVPLLVALVATACVIVRGMRAR